MVTNLLDTFRDDGRAFLVGSIVTADGGMSVVIQ